MDAEARAPWGRLVLLSFLMLFVELALIRWTGSNVVYLSYFSNFVLLGSFLGIGLGFLRARAPHNLFVWAPVALAGLVAFVRLFPVKIDRSGGELIYFGEFSSSGLPTWVTLPIIFVAVAIAMMMIAEGVARTFVLFAPLEAYRLDIIGSLLGIGAFSALSFASAPPVWWGAVAGAVLLGLHGRRATLLQAVAVLALVLMLLDETLEPAGLWSPYYKITLATLPTGAIHVAVNGIPHQEIQSTDLRRSREPIYFVPYARARVPLDDVLIVGAGNGTDVAIALRQGAKRVDAVEIDPRLYGLGVTLHPNRPYADPRVSVVIDDARAFLERSGKRYDLILFALPDSLTLVAGQSSLRLESYLFTLEAMREARAHLKPHGVFAMYNFYREQWLVERLGETVARAYGSAPCIDSVGGAGHLALFMASDDDTSIDCSTRFRAPTAPPPATDDYPFLYLRTRGIPDFYLLTIALILVASLAGIRLASGPLSRMRGFGDLFFMGAAFLLLETKNVVQFALLFGTTWFVNALVFAGILLCVLAAIEVTKRVDVRRPERLYVGLFAAIAVAFVVPQSALLSLGIPLRFVAATVLAFAPIFLANVIFAQRFRTVEASAVAFGANLVGAMVGGILEYTALVTGYRALLVLVALLYGLAYVSGRRVAASHA